MNNYHILKLINVFLLFILFIFLQCTKEDISPNETEYDFAIYMLENSELKIADIITKELSEQNSQALASIELQQNPWLTIDDFNFYDFSSHIIYLKQNKSALFPKPVDGLYPYSWWDKPFMVIANGQRRYVGIFRGALTTEKPWPFPYIEDFKNLRQYPEDLLYISWVWYGISWTDTRNDSYVMDALNNANVLHNGLSLKINKIIFTENSDTSSVEYTYTIVNDDSDNLYIIDPYKMDNGLFHYFHNGPIFQNHNENKLYESTLKKVTVPQPSGYWNPEWFTKIESGDSISRTVNLKGYPFFTSGIYDCEFIFQSVYKIPKEQRDLSDGRYWIGPTISNVITLDWTNPKI